MSGSSPLRLPRLAAAFLTAALAVPPAAADRGPAILGAEERTAAMRGVGIEAQLADPIAASEEMRRLALRVAGTGSPLERLQRLQDHLFDRRTYVFDYEARVTLTAQEAFARKRGNCVSFTSLFLALARSIDIPVHAALALRVRGKENVGEFVLVNSHVVASYRHERARAVYDFQLERPSEVVGYEPIGDRRLIAIHLNNRAVERLLEGDLARGRELLEAAVRLVPDFADAWSNLAVIHRRRGETEAALDALLLALGTEPDNPSVRSNLLALFARAARERTAAPAGPARELLVRGDEALAIGRGTTALSLYRRARRADPSLVDAHVAVARALVVKGRIDGAREALRSALELEPRHPEALRLREGLDSIRAGR